jgi:hypothetical protein
MQTGDLFMKNGLKKFTLCLCMAIIFIIPLVQTCYADVVTEDYWSSYVQADYDVYVNAPDGGVNFRCGAGVSYGTLQDDMIPNGTKLNIIGTARAENGKLWGETIYNDVCGWVFLGQCSENPPQQTSTQSDPAPSSTVSKSETSSSVNAAPSQASTEKSGDDNSYTPAPVSSETEPDIADYDSTLAADSEAADTQSESVSSPTFILALIIILLLIIIVILTAFLVIQGRKRNIEQ